MISRQEAIAICEAEFPKGLDALIQRLSVQVIESKLSVDGWCYRDPDGAYVVRLNSGATPTRKKFTLAHEIAHFILGSGASDFFLLKDLDSYDPKSPAERDADELASELLLPLNSLKAFLDGKRIDCQVLKKAAKRAKVSEAVVALRFAKLESALGLRSATVFHIADGRCKWKYPSTSIFSDSLGVTLHAEATSENVQTVFRQHRGRKIIASVPPNPNYPLVFAHLVAADVEELSADEVELDRLKRLVFTPGREGFRNQLAGMLGQWGTRYKGGEPSEAFETFLDHYGHRRFWRSDEDHDYITTNDCLNYIYEKLKNLIRI